ncbi:hypothetical protein [Herbidospora mongoliensis]|uniref:hypothetical protein n=1 Tax=Herbidospora mongoliensis TaxID=688067 RepID=UPI000A53C1D2|nr:hypothetical protein [Herbidospora mongoliensis]
MRRSEHYVIWAGALIVLAVVGLAGYVVTQLATTEPVVIAGVFGGVAALLAAIPPIIKALRGRP